MDDHRRPSAPDDAPADATSQAGDDRARIARRAAKLAWRAANPAVAAAADARWQAENAEAIAEWNAWYRHNGHPLAGLLGDDHPLAKLIER